jgi:hypothetical protein
MDRLNSILIIFIYKLPIPIPNCDENKFKSNSEMPDKKGILQSFVELIPEKSKSIKAPTFMRTTTIEI